MRRRYIIIDENKTPKHSLDEPYTYDEIKDEPNIAMLVEEPYVVLDVDKQEHFDVLCEIISDYGLKTRIMKTTRGGHFWFKSVLPLTNNVDINTPITLRTDIRSWGKKSLVTIKLNGVWRKWIKDDDTVDELPYWLRPMKWNKDFYNLSDGDGRDAGLFSCIIPLMQQKYTKNQIKMIFNIINSYVFAEPLKEREINKMFDNNDIFEQKEVGFYDGKTFRHNIFADWLLENHDYRFYGDVIYSYENGLYVPDDNIINKRMIEKLPSLKKREIVEAYENLKLKVKPDTPNSRPLVVNLRNCMFDLETNTQIEHTPDIFSINQLNCDYDPKAYSKDVDVMLNRVCCNKPELRQLLNELLGYILIGDCRFQKSFILLGEGANGKSAFLDMIINWLGRDNCSSLALEDLSEKFRTSQLVGKLLNVGDDSGADLLKNTAIFKKLVTGDPLTVEYKHGQPFTFFNKSKLVFSANNLPPSTDKSDGFLRRVIIVPFDAKFTPDSPNYDPLINEKVSTEEAKSYLLNLAIKSAREIIENNKITIPLIVQREIFKYEVGNNNVLQYCEEQPIQDGGNVNETYAGYCIFCSRNNTIPYRLGKFVEEVVRHFKDVDIETTQTTLGIIKKWKKTS
jgi:putative DNA primase/helicase